MTAVIDASEGLMESFEDEEHVQLNGELECGTDADDDRLCMKSVEMKTDLLSLTEKTDNPVSVCKNVQDCYTQDSQKSPEIDVENEKESTASLQHNYANVVTNGDSHVTLNMDTDSSFSSPICATQCLSENEQGIVVAPRNLYPNVLVSPSNDHPDIDSDEEDFQLQNHFSNHKRTDSGRGSSIVDLNINIPCTDFKSVHLNESAKNDCSSDSLGDSALSTPEHFKDASPVADFDQSVVDVLKEIEEGSEETLLRNRTSSIVSRKRTSTVDVPDNVSLDETDFTEVPLNSPACRPLNTFAPRSGTKPNTRSESKDLITKPTITDANPKASLRIFRQPQQKVSWKLFGRGPAGIPSETGHSKSQKQDVKSQNSQKKQKDVVASSTTGLIFENRPSHLPPKSAKEELKHRLLYEQMINEAKKKEQKDRQMELKKQKEQHKQEDNISSCLRTWKEEILPNWEEVKNMKRVRDLWWNGLPPSIRGKIWKLAIGNDLHITPELFQIFQSRAHEKMHSQKFHEPIATLHDSESSLVVSKENTVGLISLDVSRTFPSLCIFQKGGPYYESLKGLLGAFTCYRPDVGYVQGMSFLAAMLLLNMEPIDAFICFANLLNKPCQMAFFMVNQPMMEAYFNTFDAMLEESLPKIHSHFKEQKLSHDIYLIDWIFTLYSKSLPLDVASRVWDLFCRDGEDFLFRTAIGILNLHQDILLSLEFFYLAQYLTKLSDGVVAEKLLQSISSVSFSRTKFKQILSQEKSKVTPIDQR